MPCARPSSPTARPWSSAPTSARAAPRRPRRSRAATAPRLRSSARANVIAEYLGGASVTDEFVERWKSPGDRHTRTWEDRFGESVYPDLGRQAWEAALKAASLEADAVTKVAVHSQNARAAGRMAKSLGGVQVVDDLSATVGNTATAHVGLLLAAMVEQAEPGEVLALVSLVDGADVLLFRATDKVSGATVRPVADQVAAAVDLPYATFLAWRGEIELEPPNRPTPARPSSAVAHRTEDWKFGFVGSRDRESGALHLPPARVSFTNAHQDDMDPAPMADVEATVATFTVDRMAYSPSPPIDLRHPRLRRWRALPLRADRLRRGLTSTSGTAPR